MYMVWATWQVLIALRDIKGVSSNCRILVIGKNAFKKLLNLSNFVMVHGTLAYPVVDLF